MYDVVYSVINRKGLHVIPFSGVAPNWLDVKYTSLNLSSAEPWPAYASIALPLFTAI